MKLSQEYNSDLIGFVVTDEETHRSVNFQFDDRGNNDHVLKFGCEGDNTYEVFTEDELKQITGWLREQEGVKDLENAYDAANSLEKNEYGISPLDEASIGGLSSSKIHELAAKAE